MQEFAESQKEVGYPLRALLPVLPLVEPGPLELEWLASCVGCVEVVRGPDELNWDIDKYLLDTATDVDRS